MLERKARYFIIQIIGELFIEKREAEMQAIMKNDAVQVERYRQIKIKIDSFEAVRRLIEKETKQITPRAGFIVREYIISKRDYLTPGTITFLLETIHKGEKKMDALEWID